jgi:hypothetical protein
MLTHTLILGAKVDGLRGEGEADRQGPGETAGPPDHFQPILRNRQPLDHLGIGVRAPSLGDQEAAKGVEGDGILPDGPDGRGR